VQQRTAPAGQRRRHAAVDGKAGRGSGGADPARHLLAAIDHDHGVVLGQVDVGAKTGESPRLPALLDTLKLAGAVVTADAAHAQPATATSLHSRGAPYGLTVKGNQPTLLSQLKALPWKQVPVGARTRDRAHGRAETRTVKVVCVRAGIGFPHAAQAVQVVRRRRTRTGTWRTETAYAVTSLAPTRPAPPTSAPPSAATGRWRTHCPGSAPSPSTPTTTRSAPAPDPASWPAPTTSPSPSSTWPASRTSPQPSAATHDAPTGP
jgi:hypothetical protein